MRRRYQKSKAYKQQAKAVVKRAEERSKTRWFKKLIAFIALCICAIIVYPDELVRNFNEYSANATERMNLKVENINITGNFKRTKAKILKLSEIKKGDKINLSLDEVKEKIEKDRWVDNTTVERILPSTINIHIIERIPRAVYIKKQNFYWVDGEGYIIEKITRKQDKEGYVYLIGEKANELYSPLLEDLYDCDEIYDRVEGLVRVSGRRWDIKLKDNVTIKLPEVGVKESLKILNEFFKKDKSKKPISVVDLRLTPNKIYVKY